MTYDVPPHLVVIGVSGSGKTTVAKKLAEVMDLTFADADEFHAAANVAKMSAGEPLTDADRWPWLYAVRDWLSARTRSGERAVVACSALRRAYRDILREADGRLLFVQLHGDEATLLHRLKRRSGHFMPATLLQSQMAEFEPLGDGEDGIAVSIDEPLDEQVGDIASRVD